MAKGHWSRQRAKGAGPRGGGGGHERGPLRKIVRHRRVYTVAALPHGKSHWSDWVVLIETEDWPASRSSLKSAMQECGENQKWKDVRWSEGGLEEVLECGHCQMPREDLIGETNASRRRCPKCKAGKPADVES